MTTCTASVTTVRDSCTCVRSIGHGASHRCAHGYYWIPIARTSDPETSHQAAHKITASGKRGNLCDTFMALIEKHPGKTVGELALLENMESHKVGRRLSDLKNAGVAIQGEPRTWNGHKQVTWWPAQSQGRLLEEI